MFGQIKILVKNKIEVKNFSVKNFLGQHIFLVKKFFNQKYSKNTI